MSEHSLTYGFRVLTTNRPERSGRRAAPMSPEDRRAAIVRATVPLLQQHGHAVTTRQVAQAAGIAEGTIFRVFTDKKELIDAAIHSVLDPAPLEEDLAAVPRDAPVETRVLLATRCVLDRMGDVTTLMKVLHSSVPPPDRSPGPGRDRPKHHDGPREGQRRIQTAIALAIDDPAWAHPVDVVAGLLSGMCLTAAGPLCRGGRTPVEAEVIAEVLLHGAYRPEVPGRARAHEVWGSRAPTRDTPAGACGRGVAGSAPSDRGNAPDRPSTDDEPVPAVDGGLDPRPVAGEPAPPGTPAAPDSLGVPGA